MTQLIWFRRDLRITDNPALMAACNAAKKENTAIIAVFILTPQAWRQHHRSACQIDFILRNLQCLQKSLVELNIPLLIRSTTDNKTHLLLKEIIERHHIGALFYNCEYEVDEQQRDEQVEKYCQRLRVKTHRFHDQVLLPPLTIKTQAGKPYTVFTPFKKAVYKYWKEYGVTKSATKPKPQKKIKLTADKIPASIHGFKTDIDLSLWPAGEKHAIAQLKQFCRQHIKDYEKQRNFPHLNKTSQLSPYLSVGVLSVKQCLHAALAINNGRWQSGLQGVVTWISELLWREFYRNILVAFPRVCRYQPFLLHTKKIPWRNDKKYFQAWCSGQTGVPIVDAAMRQLNLTGWMHNRLRMVVAMFLTKNCLIDWRWGEQYFMEHLIDGDFASNNGGWQWSASTGTDAVPYFRIFNPVIQSERFDPEGEFIREYCPELAELDNKEIHDPTYRCQQLPKDYPKIILDLKVTRERAITAFKKIM